MSDRSRRERERESGRRKNRERERESGRKVGIESKGL